MKKTTLLMSLAGCCAMLGPVSALAAVTPEGLPADSRVKSVTYNENDVITLKGHYGYQTTVSFSPTEKIQNISLGDSLSWQVVPNKNGNLLFIKPVEENATTNMTVITDRRIYNFELTSATAGFVRDPNVTYLLKFTYPFDTIQDFSGTYPTGGAMGTGYALDPARPYAPPSRISTTGISSAGTPKDLNFGYSFKGEELLKPNTVFDNGEFTYFKFRDMGDLPAIFEVDMDRNESVVNYQVDGGYVVVNSVGRQFTLRHGEDEACVFNDDFDASTPVTTLVEAN